MPLHRLIDMEIGVPEPSRLDDFYQEIGLSGGKGVWGGADQPDQIKIVEAPTRQLRSMRVGCDDEADLDAIAKRLEVLGVKYESGGGRLKATDPHNEWDVIVEPAPHFDLSETPIRVMNRPGDRPRTGVRADVIEELAPRPARRLGHVVVGTPKPIETTRFFVEGIGYRISDTLGGGLAAFLRCSPDHHNLLVAPGRVPYLNHYALEQDDFDSVMVAATKYLEGHGRENQVAGPGRHQIGGNIFWYMLDPSGNIFEFFADMDRIEDDVAWQIKTDWDPPKSWSVWGDLQQPEIFFNPADMDDLVAAWQKTHV